MKKLFFTFIILSAFTAAEAQTLKDINTPKIPAKIAAGILETEDDFKIAISLLAISTDNEVILAAGAALANCPPPAQYIHPLLNTALSSSNDLRRIFAAVAIASMDSANTEVAPMLESALESPDPVIKGYSSAALVLINSAQPQDSENIFALYPYDYIYAKKALDKVYSSEKKLFAAAKKFSSSKNADVRNGAAQILGTFRSAKSNKVLISMLKKEDKPAVISAIAMALSKNAQEALPEVKKCLTAKPSSAYAMGCAIALGFMPDYSLPVIKEGLITANDAVRINSARAASAAAQALYGVNAIYYSNDISYAKQEIKTLIAPLGALSAGNTPAKDYADQALKEIKKLF